MKFLILIGFTILNSAIAFGQLAEFDFDKDSHKFGKVQEGELLEHTFLFTNSGDVPLIITNYEVACTCTKAEYSKEPILPGAQSEIKVTFDTEGKEGWQYRTIKIFANVKKSPTEIEVICKVLSD